jgi:hypothetical protein
MSELFAKPTSYEDYRRMHDEASPEAIEWLKHKCQWEHMGRYAVAREWGIPTREQAIACGVEPIAGGQ